MKHKFLEGIDLSKIIMKTLESPIKRSSDNVVNFLYLKQKNCKETEFFTQSVEQENDPFYKWEF